MCGLFGVARATSDPCPERAAGVLAELGWLAERRDWDAAGFALATPDGRCQVAPRAGPEQPGGAAEGRERAGRGGCQAVWVVLGRWPEEDRLERCSRSRCPSHRLVPAWVRADPRRLAAYAEQERRLAAAEDAEDAEDDRPAGGRRRCCSALHCHEPTGLTLAGQTRSAAGHGRDSCQDRGAWGYDSR